jgi:glycosyltransferase involved in cell wall biosynthesis
VLLPVYGRADLLQEAWSSLQCQTVSDWKLLLADDGSDAETAAWIAAVPAKDPRTTWIRRPSNLGLFANLNQAIADHESEWLLLLCSDDRLLPHALQTLETLRQQWPESRLLLSTHRSICAEGSLRPAVSARDHDRFAPRTNLIDPEAFVPLLLKYGSINGNLSGMAFHRSLWLDAGGFRAHWRHAADWEWLVRAGARGPVVINREPIADVRTHWRQLSEANRRNGSELREVAELVGELSQHPMLAGHPLRRWWAAHWMQIQLWNLAKPPWKGPLIDRVADLQAIHQAVGMLQTCVALVLWIPERWRQHRWHRSRDLR